MEYLFLWDQSNQRVLPQSINYKMEIYNWLVTAFSESFHNLTESFYYDKRDKEFYSIHFADLLLLNDDLTLNENVESSYSNSVQKLIADRILRDENKDPDIIAIPRLEVKDRKAIMLEFLGSINDLSLLAILRQRLENQDGTQRFDFYLGQEATDKIKEEWTELKYSRLVPYIDQFLQENDIDPEASRVWDIGDNFSIDLKL